MQHNSGLEVLSRRECLRLLARVPVGRVAVTSQGLPAIYPVKYLLDGGDIVFCTSSGNELAAATYDAVVAFEADDLHVGCRTGWSVRVTGRATRVTDPERIATLRGLRLESWIPLTADQFVRISMDVVTGGRLVAVAGDGAPTSGDGAPVAGDSAPTGVTAPQ